MRYLQVFIILSSIYTQLPSIMAQNYRDLSKISKTFKVAPSGTIDISNKYGSIYVDAWEKDSVKINVEFTIVEKNENRFKKIKNSVGFDFSGNSLYRSVKTQYGSSYSSLLKDLKEATNLFSPNENQTHVDYYITIPSYVNLKIENKYGNIILPSLIGDVNIKLANGDFQARALNGNNRLDLAFGSARINTIDQGNLALNFVETRISKANKLTIDSKSSDINIEETNLLKLTAKRGEIEITKAEYLFTETEFCQLYIQEAKAEANLRLKYGILKNLNCKSGFNSIRVYSDHADIRIKLPNYDAFNIKTLYSNANINSSERIIWKPTNTTDDNETVIRYGYYKNNNSNKNVEIHINEGSLYIE